MSVERCRCGHRRSMHLGDSDFCAADKCMNVCWAYTPVVLPGPGERIAFGVHRLAAEDAWTPEPLSEYWNQSERWKP